MTNPQPGPLEKLARMQAQIEHLEGDLLEINQRVENYVKIILGLVLATLGANNPITQKLVADKPVVSPPPIVQPQVPGNQ